MKIKIALIFLILFLSFWAAFSSGKSVSRYGVSIKIDPDEKYQVISVLDGDTFEIKFEKSTKTVRMLGIDTPETVDPRKPVQCFGKEASDMTKSLLSHHTVNLKVDKTQPVTDKFGRLLAYVYRDDGLFINEYLLKNGFAREYTYGRAYLFQKQFKSLQTVAKKEMIGLWKLCD